VSLSGRNPFLTEVFFLLPKSVPSESMTTRRNPFLTEVFFLLVPDFLGVKFMSRRNPFLTEVFFLRTLRSGQFVIKVAIPS